MNDIKMYGSHQMALSIDCRKGALTHIDEGLKEK